VNELEQLIGLSAGARQLVTATQDTVDLWDTVSGNRVATLEVGAASSTSRLTPDGTKLLVQRRGDQLTTFVALVHSVMRPFLQRLASQERRRW